MTRSKMYMLTGISLVMFVLLNWIFADGMFNGTFWDSEAIANSTIWTYVLLAVIAIAGIVEAQRLPETADPIVVGSVTGNGQIDDPRFWKLIMGNVHYALLWLPLRFFVGRDWLAAGEHKVRGEGWVDGGAALKGYWTNATTIPEGKAAAPSGTYQWYQDFLKYMLDHEWYTWFGKVIAYGEVLVGIGLLVGALVGIAAFFGTVMNFSFGLAGSASSNPVLFGLGVFLVLGWKVAGWIGVDRVLLPILGTPWGRLEKYEETHHTHIPTAGNAVRS